MPKLRRASIGGIVLSMSVLGGGPAAAIAEGHVNAQATVATQGNGVKAPRGQFLTAEYLEFDLLDDEELFEELRKVSLTDAKELVSRLRGNVKSLRDLYAFVPLSPGRTGEGGVAAGSSMLRVKLTSIVPQEDAYAIRLNLERWDWKNGMLELSYGIHQQDVSLKPGTSAVASLQSQYTVDVKTNKVLTRRIVVWLVHLSKAGDSRDLL